MLWHYVVQFHIFHNSFFDITRFAYRSVHVQCWRPGWRVLPGFDELRFEDHRHAFQQVHGTRSIVSMGDLDLRLRLQRTSGAVSVLHVTRKQCTISGREEGVTKEKLRPTPLRYSQAQYSEKRTCQATLRLLKEPRSCGEDLKMRRDATFSSPMLMRAVNSVIISNGNLKRMPRMPKVAAQELSEVGD